MDRILESFRLSKRAKDQSISNRLINPPYQAIRNGVYTITNACYSSRFVHLKDPNGILQSHFRPENRNAQWRVTFWANGYYKIQNVDHNSYACGRQRDFRISGRAKEQLWRIEARGIGEYTISTTRSQNLWTSFGGKEVIYWTLFSGEPDAELSLFSEYNNRGCRWTFTVTETATPLNETLTTPPVLHEPEPLLALAQIPAIPSDTDLEVLESEPYLAKHFGLHVPNLSGQVRRLNKGTIFPGTYSTVYPGMYGDKKVAIKELRMVRKSDDIQRKFRRELLIWWHLKHDNVLPLYGYFEDGEDGHGFPSLISKWAEHGSAAQYINRKLRWDQRASLFYDVAKGLKYLHTFNPLIVIVHADLKPQNVVVDINGVGQLCDFGLTRLMQDESSDLTTSTTHTGTMRYLAYELVKHQGKPIPTTATDIYALGCLGVEFIYQIRPHASLGTNYGKINYEIFSAIPPAKRPANPEEVVPILWDLVEACWSEAPEDRPTATQVSDYLAVNLEALSESLEQCLWEPEYPSQ